jgi:hypothetical protein
VTVQVTVTTRDAVRDDRVPGVVAGAGVPERFGERRLDPATVCLATDVGARGFAR